MKKRVVKVKVKRRDEVYRLYQAVQKYVEKNNGTVIIVGGIALVDEGKRNSYGVMVRCLGKKPIYTPPTRAITRK